VNVFRKSRPWTLTSELRLDRQPKKEEFEYGRLLATDKEIVDQCVSDSP
jgi:hypothetical protein